MSVYWHNSVASTPRLSSPRLISSPKTFTFSDDSSRSYISSSSDGFEMEVDNDMFKDEEEEEEGGPQPSMKERHEQLPQHEMQCKLVLIGDPGVGKTSFVKHYVEDTYRHDYRWTVGVDFALKVVKWRDSATIKLQLWDIAGQERFTSMTRVYYKDAHACIIMFDLTQRSSFLNALKWKRDLDNKCTLSDGNPVPCMLLANKCDLPYREVEQNEIEGFCRAQNFIGWTETSVKDGQMIEESMDFLLNDMMLRFTDLDESTTESETAKKSKIHLHESAPSETAKKSSCPCSL